MYVTLFKSVQVRTFWNGSGYYMCYDQNYWKMRISIRTYVYASYVGVKSRMTILEFLQKKALFEGEVNVIRQGVIK